MFKITTELKTNTGFKSSVSILEINNYTIMETIQLITGSTTPAFPLNGKTISISANLYKSISDKNAGALPYLPMDFPLNFSSKVGVGDEVNESYLYATVATTLDALGYNYEGI